MSFFFLIFFFFFLRRRHWAELNLLANLGQRRRIRRSCINLVLNIWVVLMHFVINLTAGKILTLSQRRMLQTLCLFVCLFVLFSLRRENCFLLPSQLRQISTTKRPDKSPDTRFLSKKHNFDQQYVLKGSNSSKWGTKTFGEQENAVRKTARKTARNGTWPCNHRMD